MTSMEAGVERSKVLLIAGGEAQVLEVELQNGTACFCIFIDYRGHHRKGVATYNAT